MRKNVLKWIIAIVIAGLMIADIGVIMAEAGGGGTDPDCNAGGPGATTCEIEVSGGVVGLGGSFSCSVSCGSGYYACCSLANASCSCKPESGAGGGGHHN
jgi:hypothetical protein